MTGCSTELIRGGDLMERLCHKKCGTKNSAFCNTGFEEIDVVLIAQADLGRNVIRKRWKCVGEVCD